MRLEWDNPYIKHIWWLIDNDNNNGDYHILKDMGFKNRILIKYFIHGTDNYTFFHNISDEILSKVIIDMVYKHGDIKIACAFEKIGHSWECKDQLWGGMIL